MSSTTESGSIRCPFYRYHGATTIGCEGFTDSCRVTITFSSTADKKIHKDVFCEEHYERCDVYRMVMKAKYEDD